MHTKSRVACVEKRYWWRVDVTNVFIAAPVVHRTNAQNTNSFLEVLVQEHDGLVSFSKVSFLPSATCSTDIHSSNCVKNAMKMCVKTSDENVIFYDISGRGQSDVRSDVRSDTV